MDIIILIVLSLTSIILGVTQLCEKGKPLNNSYIFASEKERASMDKKPLYRQTGIVLLIVGAGLLVTVVLWVALKDSRAFYLLIPVFVLAVGYSIASEVLMNRKNKPRG